MSNAGLCSAMCCIIVPRFVSVTRSKFLGKCAVFASSFVAIRSARILIWRSDSSPDTYSTTSFRASSMAICKMSVLCRCRGGRHRLTQPNQAQCLHPKRGRTLPSARAHGLPARPGFQPADALLSCPPNHADKF